MPNRQIWIGLSVVGMLVTAALAGPTAATKPTTTPAVTQTQPSAKPIPAETMANVNALFRAPPGRQYASRQEAIRVFAQRMEQVLELGARIQKQHPNAPNLPELRLGMLKAAHFLAMVHPSVPARKRLLGLAETILSSQAPETVKLQADLVKTVMLLQSPPPEPKADPDKIIRDFLQRYRQSDLAPTATIGAHRIAIGAQRIKLAMSLADQLQSRHAKHPNVAGYLKGTFAGRGFAAELTRLDGTLLKLPEDLKGKILVIDFWATWCAPCLVAMPEMKRLYAKYKDKGVEFVGISLDRDRSALEAYVRKESLRWIHTFSGRSWNDPTAHKYGVRGIPSVWLISPDGKVITNQARGKLKLLLRGALDAYSPAKKEK